MRGDHDVAVVFARLPGECVLQRALKGDGVRHDVMRGFPGYRGLRQDREVEVAAVLLPGLFGHLVDQRCELLQALLQAWVFTPEALHRRADDHFARWPVSRTGDREFRGRERGET